MKNRGRYDQLVVCPFYKYAESQRIGCEGVCPGSTVSLNFENPNDELAYKNNYCRNINRYRHCRVCEMLMEKYGDDGK